MTETRGQVEPIATLEDLKSVVLQRNKAIAREIYRNVPGWDFEQTAITLSEIREESISKMSHGFNFQAMARAMACSKLLKLRFNVRFRSSNPALIEMSRDQVQPLLDLAETMVMNNMALKAMENGLVELSGKTVVETELGRELCSRIAQFDKQVTYSRDDAIRERFRKQRRGKKRSDSIISTIRTMNLVLLMVRSIHDLFGALKQLTEHERLVVIALDRMIYHQKLSSSVVELATGSMEARVAEKLSLHGFLNSSGRIGSVFFVKRDENSERVTFKVFKSNLWALAVLLQGYHDMSQKLKATYAESLAKLIAHRSKHWKVIGQNLEIPREAGREDEGDTETEIDLIIMNCDKNDALVVEVKDFAFWKDFLLGSGIEQRRQNYESAAKKLEIKLAWAADVFGLSKVAPVVVTTIPEPFDEVADVPLVYLGHFTAFLKSRVTGKKPRIQASKGGFDMHVRRLQQIVHFMHRIPAIESERNRHYDNLASLKRKQTALLEQHKEIIDDLKSLGFLVEGLREERDLLNIQVREKKTLAHRTKNPWFQQRYRLEVRALSEQANEVHQAWYRLKTDRSEKRDIERSIREKLRSISHHWVENTTRLDELAEDLWDASFT